MRSRAGEKFDANKEICAKVGTSSSCKGQADMAETEFKYDVFISYSHKDEEWVRNVLLPTLEKQGLKVCIDYRDFIAGKPAIINMQDASEASHHTLLVLTPRWVESEWTLYESILSRTEDPSGLQRRTIPLLLEKCKPPKFISMLSWVDFTDKKRETEAWQNLFKSLDKEVEKIEVEKGTSEGWHLAHPYPMPPNFTGRVAEQKMLDDWLVDNTNHLFILRALGGFGKSALAWQWINTHVNPTEWTKLVWWSFYERDASFEHFIEETLKYLKLEVPQRQRPQVDALLQAMQGQKILLIMDGFERALRAYSSMNAAYQGDEEPKLEDNQLDCVNINAEIFLKSLCSLPNIKSKVLMTTRLTPRVVKPRGEFMLGCREEELTSLQPADAVEFFHKQGIKGTHAEIEAACAPYGYHPLSLRLLAGIVRTDLRTPYDIRAGLDVDISDDLVSHKNHVIEVTYNKLTPQQAILLGTLAAFRSAFHFEDIKAVNINFPHLEVDIRKLIELGLLDHQYNIFTIHPIVRQYVWSVSPEFLFSQLQGKKPALKIYPASGPVGSNIQITGVNFNPFEDVDVIITSLNGSEKSTLRSSTDKDGSFQSWVNTLESHISNIGKWEIIGLGKTSVATDSYYFEITSALKLKRPLKAFICYSKLDKDIVKGLSQNLRIQGVDPWVDEEKILPGQDWELEIEKSINSSDVIITCFSNRSINKPGYINKELKMALDVADKQPENTIFIIPLRFEDCPVPIRLDRWHWLNYFEPKGFEYLIRALEYRAKQLDLLLIQ
jgi:hypothetical protein